MSSNEKNKISISDCLNKLDKTTGHRHRGGMFGSVLATLLVFSYIVTLTLHFIILWLGSRFYFWLCKEKPVPLKPFFHFDRHKIAHLNWLDKFACEYCEWANGTFQWGLEIANKVERRFCPIQNSCDPHCEKAKAWRKDFLPYDHSIKEMKEYYKKFPTEEK